MERKGQPNTSKAHVVVVSINWDAVLLSGRAFSSFYLAWAAPIEHFIYLQTESSIDVAASRAGTVTLGAFPTMRLKSLFLIHVGLASTRSKVRLTPDHVTRLHNSFS